ncbi:MAG: PaaI family thioesterase [Alphaproteobacteria bacterium]
MENNGEISGGYLEHPMAEDAMIMMQRALASSEQDFGDFFLARLMGFDISYGEDSCTVQFDAGPTLGNPQGSLHGGVIATAMDVSMGHLLRRHHGPGITLEMKVQYLAAVKSGPVAATARFIRAGKSIAFLQSVLVDAEGTELAVASATWKRLKVPMSTNDK